MVALAKGPEGHLWELLSPSSLLHPHSGRIALWE